MQTEVMREKLFTIRMNDTERERAERVAARYGLNVAGVIRMLLKREDDTGLAHEMTDVKLPKAAKKKPVNLALTRTARIPRRQSSTSKSGRGG